MKQTIYLRRLTWLTATLAPTTLSAQVVPVYTDATDVCITCAVSGIYHTEPSVFVSPGDPKRILVTANTWRAPDYGTVFPTAQPWVTPCVTDNGGATWQCQTSAILSGTTLKIGDPASVITGAGRNYCSPLYAAEDGSTDQGCAVSSNNGVPGSWINAAFPYDAGVFENGVARSCLPAESRRAVPRMTRDVVWGSGSSSKCGRRTRLGGGSTQAPESSRVRTSEF